MEIKNEEKEQEEVALIHFLTVFKFIYHIEQLFTDFSVHSFQMWRLLGIILLVAFTIGVVNKMIIVHAFTKSFDEFSNIIQLSSVWIVRKLK